MKTLIIIPTFNCENTILDVLEDIKKNYNKLDILVVDYGSSDRTKSIIQNNEINYLILPLKTTYNQAISLAMLYAYKKKYDWAIEWSGRNYFKFQDIKKMLNVLQEKKYDLVLGSRFLNKKRKIKSLSLIILKKIIQISTKKIITDPNLNFRCYNKKIIKIFAKQQHIYISPEIIIKIIKEGMEYKEIQISNSKKIFKIDNNFSKNLKLIFFTLFIIPFKKRISKNKKGIKIWQNKSKNHENLNH